VLARRDRVAEVCAFGGAGWRVLTPGIPPHGARVTVLSRG
jgi:homoserine kinase